MTERRRHRYSMSRQTTITATTISAVATCAAAMLLLGSASAEAPDPSTDPASSEAVTRVGADERRLLERAEAHLTAECMREQGFAYEPDLRPGRVVGPNPDDHRFGLDDLAQAREHGYGLVAELVAHRRLVATDPNRSYLDGLPESRRAAFSVALFGDGSNVLVVELPSGPQLTVPRDGCVPSAQRTLYGDYDAFSRARVIVDNLRSEIDPVVGEHPRYHERLREWSTCMRDADAEHEYDGPGQIRRELDEAVVAAFERHPEAAAEPPFDVELDAELAAITEHEFDLAVAEAECARATGLTAVADRLERTTRERVEHQRRAELETVATTQMSALPRARSLIADAGE